jgi:hypothetical protein
VAISGEDSSEGKIDALYIATQRRDQRIGAQLLQHVLGAAQSVPVALECAQGNESGCRFWEKRGFHRAGHNLIVQDWRLSKDPRHRSSEWFHCGGDSRDGGKCQ